MSCNKNQSCPNSPRTSSGRISPTSDFVEDSSISEDNNSLIHSVVDQIVYASDASRIDENFSATVQNLSVKKRTNSHTSLDTLSPKSPSAGVTEYKTVRSSFAPATMSITNSCSNSSGVVSPLHLGSQSALSIQHYNHKKYLREEYKKQIKQEAELSFVSPVNYRLVVVQK